MKENKSTPRSISLYPEEWEAVEVYAKTSGIKNVSTAIRLIIQEWLRTRAAMVEVGNVTAAN